MLNSFLIFPAFAVRRKLGRGRDLGKVETVFGNPLGLDLRLPGRPSKVSLLSHPFSCTMFVL